MERPIARPAALWASLTTYLNRLFLGIPNSRIELRHRLPLVWLLLLIVLVFLLPDHVWTTLLVGFIGMFGVGFLWSRQLARGLTGQRRLRFGWVAVGDRLEESFLLINRSGFPALWVEVHDESSVPGYQSAAARAVGANDLTRWNQSSICRRRGQYHLGPWELRTGDPFGLFRVSRRYNERQEIIIHPPLHTPLAVPLPPGRSDGRTRSRERAWQATTNAALVREFQPDDPYHWIHWRTTARKGHLHVRQFEQDAAGDIWLVIDAQAETQLGEGTESTEEYAVLLAASLAAKAINEMRRVGLAVFSDTPQVIIPGLGQGQQWRLLRALALLQCDGRVSLEKSLHEFADSARRGSAAIIITANHESDWLHQLNVLAGRRIESHVLLLDRTSFGGGGNSEALYRAIRLLGFECRVIRRGDIGRSIDDQDPRGYWEFKVTGTGKAIAVKRPEGL